MKGDDRLKEEFVESIIRVEKDTRKIDEEGERELIKLREHYQGIIKEEKEKRINKASESEKKIKSEIELETRKYVEQLEKNIASELARMDEEYRNIKEELLQKYFDKIINSV
jgi:thymidylate synthase ThyX